MTVTYKGKAVVFSREDLSGAMSFFADILNIYPSNIIELPDVRELGHDPLQLVTTIMAFSKNIEHPSLTQ